jgi:hypothetical protein
MNREFREYTSKDIMNATRESLLRVDVARDAYPGGLSVAMAPLLVDWLDSATGYEPDKYFVVRNVNLSSNPVSGQQILGSVRVPPGGIERIEWVFVVSKLGRRKTRGGHAMIRFVFRKDRRPTVITNDGDALGYNLNLEDLVLSWEAWRPPLARFDPVAGLDPETYALSLRCYSGPVRCLSDSIFDRPWECYRISLPDVPHASDKVLYVCLLFGDALARQTFASMLDERIEEGKNTPHGYEADDVEVWEEMRKSLDRRAVPNFPVDEFLQGRTRYHLLESSCVTMSLMMLDAANVRIRDRAGLKPPKRVRVVPGKAPAFLEHLARGKRRQALRGMPAALHWLAHNQTVIPGRAHELLDEVGLLKYRRGEPVKSYYDNRKVTPYGRLEEHLIY